VKRDGQRPVNWPHRAVQSQFTDDGVILGRMSRSSWLMAAIMPMAMGRSKAAALLFDVGWRQMVLLRET